MSGHSAVMIIAIGTALIALWTHVRFPKLAPTEFRPALLHWIAAGLAVHLIPFTLESVSGPVKTMLALAIVGLPALTYMFLAVIWFFSVLQGMLRGATR